MAPPLQLAPVLEAKVIGAQCYGFVTLPSQALAAEVLSRTTAGSLCTPEGMPLRVGWARGAMPTWKKAGPEPHARPAGVEHPRVRYWFGGSGEGVGLPVWERQRTGGPGEGAACSGDRLRHQDRMPRAGAGRWPALLAPGPSCTCTSPSTWMQPIAWHRRERPGGSRREAVEAAREVVASIDDASLAEANLAAPMPHRPLVSYADV